jgi:hypothetical protein
MVSYYTMYLMRKRRRAIQFKQHLFQMKLFRIRMSLRERNYLSSEALFKSVEESSWYTMYANGNDEFLVNVISLNRQSFEYLLQTFKTFYIIKSGVGKSGRPHRMKDHHCVLALLLHSYCSPAENKTWCEMFGVTPSTLSRILVKAEIALDKTLNSLKEARICWPTLEEQRIIILILIIVRYIRSRVRRII